IVEVIGSYIKLQKAGANYRALCPFHSEKRPSFFVSPARQIWHCFGGCSLGGDMFKFVMKIEGVEFGDALRILAQKAGVELKRQTPEYKEWQTERNRLYEVCDLATKFFEKQIEESKTGKEAKKYLLDRGIKEESIKKWRVGYAPDVWQGLADFLTSRGYGQEEIEKAGLGLSSEKGSFYDRFRGRIIFPVFDLNSQVIGFGGRVFKEKDQKEIAKYVNTPNTLLYDKSRVLYGLNKAKGEIRKRDSCILVEGYTDVIMVSQAGNANVAATSGTALTPYQLKILKRYSENLLTAFDMDIAGDTATKRGVDLAQDRGFNIKVITMPQASDPADIISKSPKDWEKLVGEAKSILDFYFKTTFALSDPKTPEGKREISKILLPVIKRIPNKIEQAFWIQELAKKLEVKEESVEEELKKTKDLPSVYSGSEEGSEGKENLLELKKKTRKELLEEQILTFILKSPENLDLIAKKEISFFSPQISQILTYFKKSQDFPALSSFHGTPRQIKALKKNLPLELIDLINYLSLKAEVGELDLPDPKEEFKNCLKEIRILEIKNKLGQFSRNIKKAEEEKDLPKIKKLLGEFNSHSKSLRDLEAT
ncbi:DNA primase, partial [Patescibacteria group bacterium]|nr:DNA primase [Patescibacteria group bacterium]